MGIDKKNNLLKPLFQSENANTFSVLTIKARLRKNPLILFVLFAVALLVLNEMARSGLVFTTFVSAIRTTLIYCIMSVGFCLLLGYSALASLEIGRAHV